MEAKTKYYMLTDVPIACFVTCLIILEYNMSYYILRFHEDEKS